MNVDYIPRGLEDQYSRERAGRLIESLIPHGKATDNFMEGLKTKFKSVCNKAYYIVCDDSLLQEYILSGHT